MEFKCIKLSVLLFCWAPIIHLLYVLWHWSLPSLKKNPNIIFSQVHISQYMWQTSTGVAHHTIARKPLNTVCLLISFTLLLTPRNGKCYPDFMLLKMNNNSDTFVLLLCRYSVSTAACNLSLYCAHHCFANNAQTRIFLLNDSTM